MYGKYPQENCPTVPGTISCGTGPQWNPTVGENLDNKIKQLEDALVALRQSKIDMAPLLNMRIRDVRQAMDF